LPFRAPRVATRAPFAAILEYIFLNFKTFQTPRAALRFVEYRVGDMHDKFMHRAFNGDGVIFNS